MSTKKIISLEVTDEMKEALRVEAFKKSITVSALIRDIIKKSLENKDKKEEN